MQICILPFKHKDGNTYADCLQTEGTEKCPVAGGFMQVGLLFVYEQFETRALVTVHKILNLSS